LYLQGLIFNKTQKHRERGRICSVRDGNERITHISIQLPIIFWYTIIQILTEKKRQREKGRGRLRSLRNGLNAKKSNFNSIYM
jgi:hypothetical protein